MISLGQKLKLFRTDAKVSQFDIETALGMGYGSISRMESDHSVPTRYTLKKIAKYLRLNDRKYDYLVGSRETAPDLEDIKHALDLTKELWESHELLVIIRDDHFRICAASVAMRSLFGVTEEIWQKKYFLRNIISVMLDPSLPFSKMFDPKLNRDAEKDLMTMLVGFCFEMSYMRLEPDYADAVKDINNNPIAAKLFKKIIDVNYYPAYFLITQRQLKINFQGYKINLLFYTEVLPDSTRFSFIHFIPKPSTFPGKAIKYFEMVKKIFH